MKCNAFLVNRTNPKTGKVSKFASYEPNCTIDIMEWLQKSTRPSIFSELTLQEDRCDGTIRVRVSAEDEPYMGGSSAVLEVELSCDKCGHSHYPSILDFNTWLNKILEKVDG